MHKPRSMAMPTVGSNTVLMTITSKGWGLSPAGIASRHLLTTKPGQSAMDRPGLSSFHNKRAGAKVALSHRPWISFSPVTVGLLDA
jgi:hypothetical protein